MLVLSVILADRNKRMGVFQKQGHRVHKVLKVSSVFSEAIKRPIMLDQVISDIKT